MIVKTIAEHFTNHNITTFTDYGIDTMAYSEPVKHPRRSV